MLHRSLDLEKGKKEKKFGSLKDRSGTGSRVMMDRIQTCAPLMLIASPLRK